MLVSPQIDFGDHMAECGADVSIGLFEITAEAFPELIDKTLAASHARTRTGLTVVAVDREDEELFWVTAFWPFLLSSDLGEWVRSAFRLPAKSSAAVGFRFNSIDLKRQLS